MQECNHCTAPISHTETLCQDCLNAIEHATPAELKGFIVYVLEQAVSNYTPVGSGYTLSDQFAGGNIRTYKSLLKGFSVALDEPYETECGYYDNLIFTHKALNSRVELSEDPHHGISIQAYINCAKDHPDIQAHQCPKCGANYSRENPPSAQYNLCSYCVEDIQQETEALLEEAYDAINQIDQIVNSDAMFDEKQIWTADMAYPWTALSIPASFKDITFPKYRLDCAGMHSRGLKLCKKRRMLFVDMQREGLSTLVALPEPPVFNDPIFHMYVDEQLQYVPVDLQGLLKLITKSGRRYAEEVLNQPSQLEVTMSPKALSLAEVKALIPASLASVPNEDGFLEWKSELGHVSLAIGLSSESPDQVEYVSFVLQHDEATKAKLSTFFTESPTHCVDCGVQLVLGHCLECEKHNPKLRPEHNGFLDELPEYIVVWLDAVARHHMLAGVQNQGGVLSVVAERDWMNASTEHTSPSSMVCIDYVREHFFCLESIATDDSESEEHGVYLSPEGKVLVEIHPSNISILVYPNSIPAWC